MNQQEKRIAAQIEEDHRLLKESMDALVADMDKTVDLKDFTRWKLDFLWRLRDFQTQLLKHFDLEEEGGFLKDTVQLAPHVLHKVEHLEEEHQKIISDLRHITAVVKGLNSATSSKVPRLRERIRELMAVFDAHEHAETELIQSVFYQDYGIGD